TIRYLMMGKGRPLILLHGLSGSVRWWRHNLEALAEQHTVFVVDLVRYRGTKTPRFVLRSTARRLAGWMRSIEIESADFMGHSMGGAIAAEVAADFPERVQKLVLVDPALIFLENRLGLSPWDFIRCSPAFSLSLVPVLVQDALRTGPTTLVRSALDLLTSDLREKLATIQAPTLVIWGEKDGILPVRLSEKLRAHLPPGGTIRIIPGAGHNPMWERPALFNQEVLEFLRVRE
ncbi:MAG: alpha/beta fold hydrolase, partial [Chthoniobacteraceae bacterium]